jgi:hypothetical protein
MAEKLTETRPIREEADFLTGGSAEAPGHG